LSLPVTEDSTSRCHRFLECLAGGDAIRNVSLPTEAGQEGRQILDLITVPKPDTNYLAGAACKIKRWLQAAMP
jgi:hypothetical protein